MPWIALAACLALVAFVGCARKSTQTTTEQQTQVTQEPSVGHGGKTVDLDAETKAELVVDDSGMTTVYLYDATGQPIDITGKNVTVTITTPDGVTKEIALPGMGTGTSAHFMNPLDEPTVTHIKEQGSYTAKITVTMNGQTKNGEIQVTGLSTGGTGM